MLDLVLRGGTVVTADGPITEVVTDVGVSDGRIAQLDGPMEGERELDCEGLLVLPGGIDAHVHLVDRRLQAVAPEPVWVDDFWTGSQAAIAGGITCVGNMTWRLPGETLLAAVEREAAALETDAAVDWFMHPVLYGPGPDSATEVTTLAREGHTSVKVFMMMPNYDAHEREYIAAIDAAGRCGAVTLVHCEDATLLERTGRDLIDQGRGHARYFADARPVVAELTATERAIAVSRTTGAPIYVVHLSSAAALEACRRARAAGGLVRVETRPLYLHLTRERFDEPDGPKYVGAPPLREQSDRDALWSGLGNGDIDTVCSDHAPWTLEQKLDPSLDVMTARQGVADLETLMPMLYSEGVATGRISLRRFVEVTSTNAAKIFGMYPRKGTIALGSDADLVVLDPNAHRVVDGATMQSRAGYSVYDGWEVTGWPRFVVSRGEVVLAEGAVVATRGRGRWVRRGSTASI